ncbi:MAG: indole-3-glycerol phosphate synthase TrpC [Fuerstiella sp.]
MPTVLDRIITYKKQEIAERKSIVTAAELEKRIQQAPPSRGFQKALQTAKAPGLIAEVKKASPSAGIIREDFDPVTIAQTYASAGATCLSVLTDEPSFQGHLDFLEAIRRAVDIPVMRKEFIIDRYQILEARAVGADCILLIAECLDDQQLNDLHHFAVQLGMDTLIELYEPSNLPRVLATGATLIGVNNRDLRTFETSLEHTFELKASVPDNVSLVSESGIKNHADIERLASAGIAGVLVGESLMRQPDIAAAVRSLMTGS